MRNFRFKHFVIIFFIIGIVLRLYFAYSNVHPGITDDSGYITIADNMVDGKGWVEDCIFVFGNHLPDNISHNSNDFWMPMTNIILYLFMACFGKSLFVATIPLIISGIAISYITYKFLAEFTDNPVLQQGGFLLAFFLPSLFRESLLPASRIFYTLFIIWAFYWLCIGIKRKRFFIILSGIPAALAYLTRNDGILALVSIFIICMFSRDKNIIKYCFLSCLIFVLMVTPWLLRNYILFGQTGSINLTTLMFLKSYEELNNIVHDNTFANYLSWGIGNIIISKFRAFYKILSLLIYENGVMVFILSLVGFKVLLKNTKLRIVLRGYILFTLLSLIIFCFLFTFQSIGGTAGNSIPSMLPLFIIISIAGISEISKQENIQKYLILSMTVIFMFISFDQCKNMLFQNRLLQEKYFRLKEYVVKDGGAEAIVMSRFPTDLNYSTGMKAVMIPNDGFDAFWFIQKKYNVHYLILPAPREYLQNIDRNNHFLLKYSDQYSELKLYEIKPDK
jgi:hypothetical protein